MPIGRKNPMQIAMTGLLPNRMKTLFVTTLSCLILYGSHVFASGDISGVWLDDSGKGAIEVKACGSSMCGYIVWLKNANGRNGKPLIDRLNPEASRRNKPICGLQVIGQLKPQQDGSWDKGWIYDPKKGKAFDVEVRRLSQDGLQVKGYLGMKFLSETFVWRRIEGDFARCQVTQ